MTRRARPWSGTAGRTARSACAPRRRRRCRRSRGRHGRSSTTSARCSEPGHGDPAAASGVAAARASSPTGRRRCRRWRMVGVMTVRSHFRRQASACARLGSPFTARLLALVEDRLDQAGVVGRTLLRWPGDPKADALALRLAGGLHALVLSGDAPCLAAAYPGGARADDPAALRAAIAMSLEAHADFILTFLARPPQTNEVGRAAALRGGFLTVAAATGLPLRLCEIGASAGLNLHWDAYAYDLAGTTFGPPDRPLSLRPAWQGPLPPLLPVAVPSR